MFEARFEYFINDTFLIDQCLNLNKTVSLSNAVPSGAGCSEDVNESIRLRLRWPYSSATCQNLKNAFIKLNDAFFRIRGFSSWYLIFVGRKPQIIFNNVSVVIKMFGCSGILEFCLQTKNLMTILLIIQWMHREETIRKLSIIIMLS
jgi:hypothetical protein